MRHPLIATVAIVAFMLAACGRMDLVGHNRMSESEAMDSLAELPMESGGYNFRGRRSQLSAAELIHLIEQHAPKAASRNATASETDLSGLVQMLSLIQGGTTSIGGLAQGMVSANGNNSSVAGSKLNSIMSLINAIMPIIMTIAPQYAPILQAIVTIVPLVVTFISLFKRSKPARSAWLPGWVPLAA